MKRSSFHLLAALVLAMAAKTPAVAQNSPFTNLNWQACAPGSKVQCATTKVPLDWTNPGGQQIDYFLRLYPAAIQPAPRAIVYVAGGPGSTGRGGEGLAQLQSVVPDLDVIAPDHRGTGRSTWFGCNQSKPLEDLSTNCIQQLVSKYGPQVGAYFSATQAAKDLGALTGSLRSNGKKVYIYGESYGTFLVNRYLNLYPAGVDAAILDGIERPDGAGPFLPGPIDLPENRITHAIFDGCSRDRFCSEKLGANPWAVLGNLQTKVAAGYCSQAFPAGTTDPSGVLKSALFQIGLAYPGAAQTALVYRLNRCSAADVSAVEYFGSIALSIGANFSAPNPATSDGSTPAQLSSNELLGLNIELSDSFGLHPPAADLIKAAAAAYVEDLSKDQKFLTAFNSWPLPLYDPGVARQWANTSMPLLLIEGGLDTKTPPDVLADVLTYFSNPHQQYVLVPNATHVTLQNSSATASTNSHTCGFQIIASFLQQPAGPLNTQCTAEIPALDFAGSAALARALFGTSDLYEDAGPSIFPEGVLNGASFQKGLAPGAIMTIYGTNLSRGFAAAGQSPLPPTLGGTSVTVNGVTAPLYYVSNAQVNAQIPVDTPVGSATVTVTVDGKTSTQPVDLTSSAPGIFANPLGLVLPGVAKAGDRVTVYITGQGPLTPQVPTGSAPDAGTPADQAPRPALPVTATVGGFASAIQYIGVPIWAVGTTQIDFLVPGSVRAGRQEVRVTVGTETSPPAVIQIAN